VGPPQHLPNQASHQDGVASIWSGSRPRCRRCLLKGCERRFCPSHPLSRYCSPSCQSAARRWSCWRAGRRYRQTDQGRQCRREQCRRYRQRVRCRKAAEEDEPAAGEGHHKESSSEKSPCTRPGCYEVFQVTPRSPAQKFCGPLCRKALRCVLVREARWRRGEGRRSNQWPVTSAAGSLS
jgi:hypothetical protein